LFWDEPEANLNPVLIKVIARLLYKLAEGGVQIFIATHDYLLTHELSLYAQYKRDIKAEPTKGKGWEAESAPEFRFFGLSKDENGQSKVEAATTISGIQNDAILSEFATYYDLERKLSLETFKQREI
jgi:ABC-type transporter Mla maintaining outer membrane lipid asymmetry ATPase subunit MlaF